jgi:MFS family permease
MRGLAVLRAVLRAQPLRWLALGYLAFTLADYGSWIAIVVYAFDHGGPTAAAIVVACQLVPAALLAPIVGAIVDRHGPIRGLALGYAAEASTMAIVALLVQLDAPPGVVYVAAVGYAVAFVATRPAQAAALPLLTTTPDELAATNVVNGWMETAGAFAGPALAGVLLSVSGTAAAFLVFATLIAAAAAPIGRLRDRAFGGVDAAPTGVAGEGALAAVAGGIREVRAVRGPLALVALLAAGWALLGLLDVLNVVLAVEVFGLGEGGPGYLGALYGVGAVAGGAISVVLIGRAGLATPMLLAIVIGCAPLALLSTHLTLAAAEVALVAAGCGVAIAEVAGRTLLQRAVPGDRLASIFGLLEGAGLAAEAAGAAVIPILIRLGGARIAVLGTGLMLPAAMALALRSVRRVETIVAPRALEVETLRGIPLFAPLGPAALEGLAAGLERSTVPANTAVVRQGDVGDRYHVVVRGTLEVVIDGVAVRTIGQGDGFGEIALLHDVPRTATVETLEEVELLSLGRAPFIEALTGHRPSGSLPA